ncbi:hypothetical protein VIGAN_07155200, partial [Vigna angularis var. angularis]
KFLNSEYRLVSRYLTYEFQGFPVVLVHLFELILLLFVLCPIFWGLGFIWLFEKDFVNRVLLIGCPVRVFLRFFSRIGFLRFSASSRQFDSYPCHVPE